MQDAAGAATFSGKAVVLFSAQVLGAVIGIVNGILLARLLGPSGKGDYYILILVPSTTMVLMQFGLPLAVQFFSARGRTSGLLKRAVALTAILSIAGFLGVTILLPVLRDAVYHDAEVWLIYVAFLAFPIGLAATFATGIVMGRQAVRWYAMVNIGSSIATTGLMVVILGGLGASVPGAVAVFLITAALQAVGFAIGSRRVIAATPSTGSVSFREILRYGVPFYPGTLTQFFSYRADVYLIAILIADPSEPLGYYSMAVGLAELVFFFPNAVSSLFFPHVAGSRREDADRQAAMVARVTLLVTIAAAIALVPGAILMISILLPAFGPSIPPLLVLLPGVVALSLTKVLGGYVAGIGRPGVTSYIHVLAFVLNIVANVVLIPRYGIVGASAASLLSYSMSSLAFTLIVSRLAHTPITHFLLPRLADLRYVLATSMGLVRRMRDSARAAI